MISMEERAKFLKSVKIFQGMNDDEISKISNLLNEENFIADRVVFKENDAGTKWYFVKSGTVKITKKSEKTGKEEPLAIIKKEEFFGEMALLDDKPRCATATAKENSVLLSFRKQDFKKIIEENPALTLKIYKIFIPQLCKKLRETDKHMVDSFFTPSPLDAGF
ncbi:MAG: cyclic nucleotide-binding domain-containing protein [Elusimicrobia bacterium]|nr:cyclic nucleotide-binding domain-containing protein [Elusimicrobiota bacterium]